MQNTAIDEQRHELRSSIVPQDLTSQEKPWKLYFDTLGSTHRGWMMDADFKFDLTRSGWAVIEGSVLDAKVSDIILDSPARRGPGGGPFRRALVHDQSDGLTVNFNGDYPGGVRINNVSLNLKVLHQSGGSPVLPKEGSPGDILMIVNTTMIEHTPVGVSTSLWLCVPASTISVALGATWQQIQLGSTVHGTG